MSFRLCLVQDWGSNKDVIDKDGDSYDKSVTELYKKTITSPIKDARIGYGYPYNKSVIKYDHTESLDKFNSRCHRR